MIDVEERLVVSRQRIAADRDIARGVAVELYVCSVTTGQWQLAMDFHATAAAEDAQSGARWRDLGVAVEPPDDLHRLRSDLSSLWIAHLVDVECDYKAA